MLAWFKNNWKMSVLIILAIIVGVWFFFFRGRNSQAVEQSPRNQVVAESSSAFSPRLFGNSNPNPSLVSNVISRASNVPVKLLGLGGRVLTGSSNLLNRIF